MALLITAALFLFLMSVIALAGYYWYAKPGRVYEQLGKRSIAITQPVPSGSAGTVQRVVTSLQWLGEKIPVSPQKASLTARFLMAAGYRTPNAVAVFYGIKVASAVLVLALALLGRGMWSHHPVFRLVMPFMAPAAGFAFPGMVLGRLIKKRKAILRLSLPDALDLMVVCVEAGLGLDQAIRVVSRELQTAHPELSQELALVSLEMRAGTRRADALTNLAKRTGEEEVRKLVAVLLQSDRFGTSMAESLRTHSDFLRVRRRQEAEERA